MKKKTSARAVPHVIGYYNALYYSISVNGREVYRAGNSRYDSQGYVSASSGVGRAKMRSHCIKTGREIAAERKGKWLGCEYEDPSE